MSGIGMSGFLEKHIARHHTHRSSSTRAACSEQEQPLISGSSSPLPLQVAPASWNLLVVMVFLEAIGLYGLIVALILSSHDK